MTPSIIFDDGRGELSPLTDLRPVFDLRTGALTTLARLAEFLDLDVLALYVPPHLEALTRESHAEPVNQPPRDPGAPLLLINGRCPLPLEAIDELDEGQALFEDTGDLVAARLPLGAALRVLATEPGVRLDRRPLSEPVLLSRPWHFRRHRDVALDADLEALARADSPELPEGVVAVGDKDAAIDPSATVYPGVILVCEKGPVVIGAGATVRPGAVINGPAYVGEGTVINEQAIIKPHTAIGPHCRVGGEVAGTIFQGYSNKSHDGYLGDSWVGEWVNLGAGTVNSNLLNTYGEVAAQASPRGPREPTGEQFFGAVIGDHVKTAIGTRLMTGAVVGTGTMWAAAAPLTGCTAPFTWATDQARTAYRPAAFEQTLRAMMSRRGLSPSQPLLDRIAALMAAAHA